MKLTRRKYPNCLEDSKRSSVNWMAAGSRLSRSSHGFFLLCTTFQTYLIYTFNQTRCPTDFQHLYCKALINKQISIQLIVAYKLKVPMLNDRVGTAVNKSDSVLQYNMRLGIRSHKVTVNEKRLVNQSVKHFGR